MYTLEKDLELLLDFENRFNDRMDDFIKIEKEQTERLQNNLVNAASCNERISIFNQYFYNKMCQQTRIMEICDTLRSIEKIRGRLQIHQQD